MLLTGTRWRRKKMCQTTTFVHVCIVIERVLRKIQPHLNEGSTLLHSREEKGAVHGVECCSSGWSACETHCMWTSAWLSSACSTTCPQQSFPCVSSLCYPRQLVNGLYRNLVVQWPTPHLWNFNCGTNSAPFWRSWSLKKEDVHVWSQYSVLRPAV